MDETAHWTHRPQRFSAHGDRGAALLALNTQATPPRVLAQLLRLDAQ